LADSWALTRLEEKELMKIHKHTILPEKTFVLIVVHLNYIEKSVMSGCGYSLILKPFRF
jgi:hypothetical protein